MSNIDDNFVVYAFSRSGKDRFGNHGTYYYIGKGRPSRPYYCYGRKTAKCPKDRKNNIHVLYSGLDEKTAFEIEVKLIAKYGRMDLYPEWGILRNRTNGGEGASGRQLLEETKEKISNKNKNRKNPRKGRPLKPGDSSYRPIDWYHPVHGEVKGKSVSELVEMFPEDSLKHQTLRSVSRGKIYQHKKWRLLINKETDFRKKYKHDWYNPLHGEILQKSISDLQKMFLDQSLCSTALSQVIKGKFLQYKGWRLLKNKDVYNNKSKNIPRNWYHPVYGEVIGVSCSSLIKMFPEQNLNRGNLVQVSKGKSSGHKNWRLFHGPILPPPSQEILCYNSGMGGYRPVPPSNPKVPTPWHQQQCLPSTLSKSEPDLPT